MTFTQRDKDVMLASCWGCMDALHSDKHLGDAARARGLESRTLKGDAYETAFEWARQERAAYRAIAERVGEACSGVSATWCPRCGDCTCPADEDEAPVERNDPNCPLHSPSSPHAEKPKLCKWCPKNATAEGLCDTCRTYRDAEEYAGTPRPVSVVARCGRCRREDCPGRHQGGFCRYIDPNGMRGIQKS